MTVLQDVVGRLLGLGLTKPEIEWFTRAWPTYPLEDLDNVAAVPFLLGSRVSGQSFEEPGVLTTNQTAWVDALTGTVQPLTAGVWVIEVSYLWAMNNQTNDFRSRMFIDGANVSPATSGDLHREEVKDSAGAAALAGSGTDQIRSFSHRFIRTYADGDTPDFLLQFASSAANIVATIGNPIVTWTYQ